MTRNKFNEELKQLLNSVRVMGVNLEDTLDKVSPTWSRRMQL